MKKTTVYIFVGTTKSFIRGSFLEKVCVCACACVLRVCGWVGGEGWGWGAKQFSSLSRPITSTHKGSRSRICRSLTPGQIHTTLAVFRRVRKTARSDY